MVSKFNGIIDKVFVFTWMCCCCVFFGVAQERDLKAEFQFRDILDHVDSLLEEDQNEKAKSLIDSIQELVSTASREEEVLYHKLRGDYFLSENLYQESANAYEPLLELSVKELGKDASLKYARAVNDLGIAYMKIGSYDEAIEAHLNSQVIYDHYDEPQGGSYNYNNIAIIYTKLKKIDSALFFHDKSLSYAKHTLWRKVH